MTKCTILIFLVTSVSGYAQTTLGVAALRGAVQDQSSGMVAGAKVTLTEEAKGLVRESESDTRGSFLFPAVIAGVYAVRVEKKGFRTEEMRGLRIEVGEQLSIAITLRVGETHSEITVAQPTTTELKSESNTIGSVVDSTQVRELPLNGRNFLQLAKLAAGTVDVSPASNLFDSNVGPPDRTIVLPGTLPNSVTYFLNGINVTGSRDGELALSPSVTAIDQFRVQQSFLMPDQGVNSAVVNIVTTGGSNRFHGEAWEFLRNRSLDARSFFAAGPEQLKRNQFGLALGGPLRKDRVWFYGFYEGIRELTGFSSAGYSPTREMFEGDFAATGRIIYNPASYDPASGTRAPFPNNVIPPNEINPVAKNLLKYYLPGSSLASIPSNIRGNPTPTLDDNQGGLRLDAALNPRQQIFAQFFRQNTPTDQPALFPLSGLLYLNDSTLAMIQYTWAVSPRAANTVRAGFLRNTAIGANEAEGLGPILASIGISNTFETDGVTAINLQGYSPFGQASGDVGNRDNTWQANEEFTLEKSGHSLAFGAGLLYRRGWHANGNSFALGSLSFQPVFTAQMVQNPQGQPVPAANTGDSFADFLLGYPVSGLLAGAPSVGYRSTQFAPFVQDSWRVTPGLTLNYGLTWYLETPPNPQGQVRDFVHVLDSRSGLLAFAGLGQINPQTAATDWNNFAPRLGVAWKPKFVRDTVVRGAVGVYYSAFPWSFAAFPVGPGSPSIAGASFSNAQTNPLPTYVLGVNIFPRSPGGGLTPRYAESLPPGTTATVLDPGFRTGYVSQWNLSVQHSLGGNDSIEVDYVGAGGHRLPNVVDLSQCRPTSTLLCSPSAKAWPRYGLLLYADSGGNSSYEALMANYEHRLSSGFNLRFEYAFAKALTDTYQSSLSSFNQITTCRRCSKGPATFDVRHRAAGSVVWELPFGRRRPLGRDMPRWAEAAAGGWTVTAITTFATGQPVILTAPNQTGSAFITPLPNRVCDGRDDRLSDNLRSNGFLWFNPACFAVPAVGYFGNSGPTVLGGPGINNWDIGVQKSFVSASEPIRLQFRAEFFNAWNHAQFDRPNGNAGAGANFGRISATRPPRLIQVAVKLYW